MAWSRAASIAGAKASAEARRKRAQQNESHARARAVRQQAKPLTEDAFYNVRHGDISFDRFNDYVKWARPGFRKQLAKNIKAVRAGGSGPFTASTFRLAAQSTGARNAMRSYKGGGLLGDARDYARAGLPKKKKR